MNPFQILMSVCIIVATLSILPTATTGNPVSGYGAAENEPAQSASSAPPARAEPEIDSGINYEAAATPEDEADCIEKTSTVGPITTGAPLKSVKYKRSAQFGSGRRRCVRFG